MFSAVIILIGWIVQLLTCFYFIRFISNTTIRCLLTIIPCIILTYMVADSLFTLYMPSMLLVTYCWLTSFRLMHLIVLSPAQCSTIRSFASKIFWMFFPIVPCTTPQQWPILYDFISASMKIIINHWIYGWLLTCKGSDSYIRLIIFYIFLWTCTFVLDIESAIVRIVTRNQYMLISMTNFPILSQSVREFWGRRHNQLVGTVLRESIFQPIRQHLASPTVASLIAFLLSGLLHVHLAFITFKDVRSTISTFIFFLLHGIICSIETHSPIRFPEPLPWIFTQLFLLATVSLQLGPFTRIGPEFYAINPPPLFEQKWLPKLSIPNFCPN